MKTKLIALLTLLSLTSAYAQRPANADRQQMREDMTEKQATRLAKDFELKDDAKTEFIKQYKAYQQELRGENRERQQRRPEGFGGPQREARQGGFGGGDMGGDF